MDWNTPEEVLELVRKVAPIGLDPCSNVTSKVKASAAWLSGGLEVDWGGFGLVYVNPPYGRELKQWAFKIIAEQNKGTEIIALVPSRTDTQWFQMLFEQCDRVCFWKGRITFVGAPAPAPFPSAVFYFGHRPKDFEIAFEDTGIVTDAYAVDVCAYC